MAFQFIRPFEILQGITTFEDNNESGEAKKAIHSVHIIWGRVAKSRKSN